MLTRLDQHGQGGPFGAVLAASEAGRLVYLALGDDPDALRRDLDERIPGAADSPASDAHADAPFLASVLDAVSRYVKHAPSVDLGAIPVRPAGTDFQRRVWDALRTIPVGETRTYAQIASSIGMNAAAARAVGAACGANPIAIVIPCHRAIGADGSLTGFRWGLDAKRALLDHESAQAGLFA